MKQWERWAWFGGSFVGCWVGRALAHRFPVASFVTLCATIAWFLAWLLRDNLQFRKEVAAQRQRLAERRTAFRAARDAALEHRDHR